MSQMGQNENPPFSGLCQLPLGADMAAKLISIKVGMSALSFHGVQITEGRCVMAIQISHQRMQRVTALVVGASRIAGALLIAGLALTFTSGQTEATSRAANGPLGRFGSEPI